MLSCVIVLTETSAFTLRDWVVQSNMWGERTIPIEKQSIALRTDFMLADLVRS